MKKKIYIAGKVSGENREDCLAKFAQAQASIEKRNFEALSPMQIVSNPNTPWNVAMKMCIAQLLEADAMVILPDWHLSQGAIVEKDLAMKLGIPVFEANFFGFEKLQATLWNQ